MEITATTTELISNITKQGIYFDYGYLFISIVIICIILIIRLDIQLHEFISKNYQRLGDFFTGTKKRQLFNTFILVGFVGVIWVNYFIKFALETDVLFWFFSSVVQSLMALVGLMGVFVVFKYQSMSTREDRLLEEMNKDNSALAMLGGDLNATSSEELLEKINPHLPEPSNPNEGFRITQLRRVQAELKSQGIVRSYLKEYMIKVCVYAFFVVLVSLLLITFVPFLTATSSIAITSLYLGFVLVADVLRLVIKIIAAAFNE
jgi:hypothetical protein